MKKTINIQHLVPKNKMGSSNDAVATKTYADDQTAIKAFNAIEKMLFDVNSWTVTIPFGSVHFYLADPRGKPTYHEAEMGDFVKIKMPMLANSFGNGFDWVYVTKISKFSEGDIAYTMIEMKPHSCIENAAGQIAHFYTNDSTNTFIVARSGSEIQVSVHGRNEIPNVKKLRIRHRLRNFFIGGGGIFGGSKLQWQNFVDTLIKIK
jgi:hypothetical protein